MALHLPWEAENQSKHKDPSLNLLKLSASATMGFEVGRDKGRVKQEGGTLKSVSD